MSRKNGKQMKRIGNPVILGLGMALAETHLGVFALTIFTQYPHQDYHKSIVSSGV